MNLKQLSDMLALSQTTVSRALNGYPEVNEETRRRVADAAKRHGYRPNPERAQAGHRQGRHDRLCDADRARPSTSIRISSSSSPVSATMRAATTSIWCCRPTTVEDEETTYRRIVANKQVDAVYVSSPLPADRRVTLLNQLGMPVHRARAQRRARFRLRLHGHRQ